MPARDLLSRLRARGRRGSPDAGVAPGRRRCFAVLPGLAVTALSAPSLAAAPGARPEGQRDTKAAREPQYQETDHVRRYYNRLRE